MATKKDDLPSAGEARAELQRMLRVFKAFEHADKALAVLENLEQVQSERTKAAADAAAQLDAARAELIQAQADVITAKAEAKDIRARAKKDAGDVVAKAIGDGTAIVEPARQEATQALAQAIAARAELADLQQQLRAAQETLEQARSTIAKGEKLRQAMAGV